MQNGHSSGIVNPRNLTELYATAVADDLSKTIHLFRLFVYV